MARSSRALGDVAADLQRLDGMRCRVPAPALLRCTRAGRVAVGEAGRALETLQLWLAGSAADLQARSA
jgi:hypothetical protein